MAQSRDTATTDARRAFNESSRSSRRLRKGCPECRRRKIKCDEKQPRCGQCQKGSRKCRILDSVFRQHTFTVEQTGPTRAALTERSDENDSVHSPGVTDDPEAESANIEGDGTASSGFTPRQSTGIETCQQTGLISNDTSFNSFQDAAIPLRNTVGQPDNERPVGCHPVSITGELQEIAVDPNHSRRPFKRPNDESEDSTIDSLKDTQEELFLLRHYSECIAPWMDLLYRYEVFSREVLTLARDHPILRYAACAVAAKQLGQMRSPLEGILRGRTQQKIAQKFTQRQLGFVWYGAKYYEKAIQTLVKSITPKDPQSIQSLQNQLSSPVSLSKGDLMVQAEGEDPIVRLLGTCILIQYEHLSATGSAWAGHLTGFSKLLDLIEDGKLLHPHAMFEQVYPFTKDIMEVKAGFWNFVVNDLEESFLSHRRTRIDTENLALWRNMGLIVEDDGSVSTNFSPNSLSATPEHARDKALAYTLIRPLCKLVNYLAPLSNLDFILTHPGSTASGPVNAEYVYLETQFDTWHEILSPSFHPDGTFLSENTSSRLFSHELWFSNDLCSTTMMYYHMARMLLLIHRPSTMLFDPVSNSTRTPFDLLRTYRGIEQQLQLHAAEVVAIVQGTPCDAVKLRSIQPLYVVGRCCTDTPDRRLLFEMLRDIQDSLGIATEYRIRTLLQEWALPYEALGFEERPTSE